ncbi:transposase [Patescibacteria group bacterium]
MNDKDYLRFIHDLFEFNDENPVLNSVYYFDPKTMKVEGRYLKNSKADRKPRKLLVEILIFTLMPNHFHLLLKQNVEDGIVKFMQKLGIGYTMYFNQKHKRVGPLFQGKFKAVMLEEHAHLLHLPHYIHANPLKLANYRDPISIVKQLKFLEEYGWSSLSDYVGKKNFPSITQREFLLDFFGGKEKYKKETKEWLKNQAENKENIQEILLE